MYILIMRRGHSSVCKQRLCLHMDPYVLTFYLGLGIGVIRPAFDISILSLFGYHIHFFGLLLNREIGLIIFLIYIRYPPDNSNRSNLMSDSGLYDRSIEILQHSTFVIYSIYHIRQISYSWNTIHFQDALMVKWQTRETQNLVLKSVEVRVLFKA